MRFTARPRMGGRRAVCDGIVVILVVADPLWGAGPAPPLRGRAVTINKFLCEGRLQGVSCLINGFGVSIKHAIKCPGNCFGQVWVSGELFWASLGFSFSILLFHASDVFGQEIQAFSSISSVRCAEVVGVRRGAESVIGNLLASGRTFRTRSARL